MDWYKVVIIYVVISGVLSALWMFLKYRKEIADLSWYYYAIVGISFGWFLFPFQLLVNLLNWGIRLLNTIFEMSLRLERKIFKVIIKYNRF
jgi:hypothetical protein